MDLLGRGREIGWLRTTLDRTEASVIALSGPPGSGTTRLALAAAADHAHHYHRVPPLTEPQQRAALARTLGADRGTGAVEATPDDVPWDRLLRDAEHPGNVPSVLILDDAHRLAEARARFLSALRTALLDARRRGRTLHVLLVSPEQPPMEARLETELAVLRLEIGPLTFRAALPRLPGSDAAERLRSHAVFGGAPGHLVYLDPGLSLTTNLRRAVLDDRAPLIDAPTRLLERRVQAPARYVAVLRALSAGEAEWGVVHRGVPDVTASGQLAPYLKRLVEMGLVEVRRSLDASPRSRNRRYRIVDPFTAFWFRFVFPHRERLAVGDGVERVSDAVRAGLEEHVASFLPEVCRQYMRHDAIETMGSNARECGSLWGPGYDIPVAGILGSGAAFYGRPISPGSDGLADLAALDREVRETRYGFGRERRLRVLFVRGGTPLELAREAARRHDVVIVREDALSGDT